MKKIDRLGPMMYALSSFLMSALTRTSHMAIKLSTVSLHADKK